jgi:hypothetical protein
MNVICCSQITDAEVLDLIISILDSPYANFLIRQFVLTAITKMSSRPTTSPAQQERISTLIAGYSTNPELEIQQRGVEFANLLSLSDLKSGVLERMPAPELKATVMGYGSFLVGQTTFLLLNLVQETARTSPSGPLKVVIYWVGMTSRVLPRPRTRSRRWRHRTLKTYSTRSLAILRPPSQHHQFNPLSRPPQHHRHQNHETRSTTSWVYSQPLLLLRHQTRSTRRCLRSVDWEAA